MGTYTKQIEQRQERKEKDKVRREKLAGFFYDLAKLSFAGLVIGGITPAFSKEEFTGVSMMLIFGSISSITFSVIATRILKQ